MTDEEKAEEYATEDLFDGYTKINYEKKQAYLDGLAEGRKEIEQLKKDCSIWESRAKGLLHKNEMVDVYGLQKENAELKYALTCEMEERGFIEHKLDLVKTGDEYKCLQDLCSCYKKENEGLKNEIDELKALIEKMKNVGNCKHSMKCAKWNEKQCNLGLMKFCLNCKYWELAE